MHRGQSSESIFLLGAAAAVPERRASVDEVLRDESNRYAAQLAALSPKLRARIDEGVGVSCVPVHEGAPSDLARTAARQALDRASVSPKAVRLVVDYSTLPGDHPAVWSLANQVQGDLDCAEAMALSASGAGCAGLHLALRTAIGLMHEDPNLDVALLVASDCVRDFGRCCLPVGILGDAGSALVLGTREPPGRSAPRVLSVVTSTLGAFHDVIHLAGCPPRMHIDGRTFEAKVLPLHFVMSQRVLERALAQADRSMAAVARLVYPNTTELDRASVIRALGLAPERLCGPGPVELGHAFASDMLLNLPPDLSFTESEPDAVTALLAVGSGFTWGACVVG